MYVEETEKTINLGTDDPNDPYDAEADEVDLRACLADDHETAPADQQKEFEQWGGYQKRGFPESLILMKLKPKKTTKRAPGPGAIRLRDWKPFAKRKLKDSNIILHTDGAKTYKLKIRGMLHDHVVHSRKKLRIKGKIVKRNGNIVWIKPHYTKVFTHTLPNGKTIKVQGGTQIIDRFWRKLRASLKGNSSRVGSLALRRRIRSAQWDHWQQKKDKWAMTGEMLRALQVP